MPSADQPVEMPAVGDALQLVLASASGGESGTRNKVSDRLRNQISDEAASVAILASTLTANEHAA
jgi:hypothetical protein